MNHYKIFADKANELGLSLKDYTQLEFIAKQVPDNTYNYLFLKIREIGVYKVFDSIKKEM